MNAGFFQFKPQFAEMDRNLDQILYAMDNSGARLLVLPELALSGYNFNSRGEAVSLAEDAEKSDRLHKIIEKCKTTDQYVVLGFAELDGDNLYNSAAVIGPEGIISIYRKLHLFDTEKQIFDAGNIPLKVVKIDGVNIGMMICFDWYFPEVTRKLALSGAQIICHPSNLVLSFCQQAMITRCLENKIIAITANRIGAENRAHNKIRFTGKSQITGPNGYKIYQAGVNREELYAIEIDTDLANNKWITEKNHVFDDRRTPYYI